jgi:predicted dehydrogenase
VKRPESKGAGAPNAGGPAKESIKVGVIAEPTGAHLNYFFRALANAPGISRIAIADTTGEIFDRGYLAGVPGRDGREPLPASIASGSTTGRFTDYRAMLAAVEPDLVLVGMEAHHAPAPIEAALRAGCHVLVDHPACVRLEDFERVEKLAAAGGRHLIMAFATRTLPPARKARELVEAGFLGKIYAADLYTIADQTRLRQPEYRRSWYASRSKEGGGHLIRLGIHYIDVIQYIVGERIRGVTGFYGTVGGQPVDIEDAAVAALEFGGGAVATLHSGYYVEAGYDTGITLWGSEGWLRFDHVSGTPLEWHSTRAGAPAGVERFAYPEPPLYGYQALVHAAVEAARGATPPPVTGAEALHDLRVVFGLYRACDTGRTQVLT